MGLFLQPNLSVHLNAIDKTIKFYSKTYDKILIAENFNEQVNDIKLDIEPKMFRKLAYMF